MYFTSALIRSWLCTAAQLSVIKVHVAASQALLLVIAVLC